MEFMLTIENQQNYKKETRDEHNRIHIDYQKKTYLFPVDTKCPHFISQHMKEIQIFLTEQATLTCFPNFIFYLKGYLKLALISSRLQIHSQS